MFSTLGIKISKNFGTDRPMNAQNCKYIQVELKFKKLFFCRNDDASNNNIVGNTVLLLKIKLHKMY